MKHEQHQYFNKFIPYISIFNSNFPEIQLQEDSQILQRNQELILGEVSEWTRYLHGL